MNSIDGDGEDAMLTQYYRERNCWRLSITQSEYSTHRQRPANSSVHGRALSSWATRSRRPWFEATTPIQTRPHFHSILLYRSRLPSAHSW